MSKEAKVIEKFMDLIGLRRTISKMMLNPKRNGKYTLPPKILYRKYDAKSINVSNRKCVSLKSSANPEKHLFYFPGGAYTLEAKKMHWKIIEHILEQIKCEITFVNYPLSPEYTCIDTIEMVSKVYSHLCKKNEQEIVLIGDSAGGGLALSFAQFIQREGIQPMPAKIVLLSPWLDVSMDNDISKEQKENDLILDKETLTIIGERYAGNLDAKNYLCSPLYGDLAGIGEIALFTGTSDILHVQANLLRNKLLSTNHSFSSYEYEQMQHVWIGFPIPEAKDAMDKVISFIRK